MKYPSALLAASLALCVAAQAEENAAYLHISTFNVHANRVELGTAKQSGNLVARPDVARTCGGQTLTFNQFKRRLNGIGTEDFNIALSFCRAPFARICVGPNPAIPPADLTDCTTARVTDR